MTVSNTNDDDVAYLVMNGGTLTVTGTFTPTATTLNATYNASAADVLAGNVILILTSANNGLCVSCVIFKNSEFQYFFIIYVQYNLRSNNPQIYNATNVSFTDCNWVLPSGDKLQFWNADVLFTNRVLSTSDYC